MNNDYAKGWWDAMDACRERGIPTAPNKHAQRHDEKYEWKEYGVYYCKECKATTVGDPKEHKCIPCKPIQPSGEMTATAKRPDLKDECEHGNKPNSCWACSYKAQENKYDLIPLEEKKVAKVVSDVLFNRQEPVYNNSDVAKAICQKFGTPNTKKAEVISVEEKDFRFHGYNISQLIEIINFAKQHGYAEKN